MRVLLDDFFTGGEVPLFSAFDAHPNVSVRIYNPYRNRPDALALRTLFNLGEFGRVNHRMHNKTMSVDGRVAIVGGRNLADEYFGHHETYNFRDMEALVSGSVVPEIEDHFDRYWNSGWSAPIASLGGEPLSAAAFRSTLPAIPPAAENPLAIWLQVAREAHEGEAQFWADRPASEDPESAASRPNQVSEHLVRLLDGARRELLAESAYLIPTEALEAAIRRAKERGVRVRLLTNSLRSNNHLAAHSAYARHLERLLGWGVELHEVRIDAAGRGHHMRGPVRDKRLGLHAKLLVVDDAVVVLGSANLDPRSLRLNTEAALTVRSPSLNAALRAALEPDFAPENAWRVSLGADGALRWEDAEELRHSAPADSPFQRLEDWFLSRLPAESQL